MTRTVLLATTNSHKRDELERILLEQAITTVQISTLDQVRSYPDPVESGQTFADNALIKALAGYQATGLACIGDDSGLAVDALHGMPGVLSARWAGIHGDDRANIELLLGQMHDIPDDHRGATFHCCCALVWGMATHQQAIVEGTWRGHISHHPRGSAGFGYDPIFIPHGLTCTVAELTPEYKNTHSHRYQALCQLVTYLRILPQE